MVLIFIKTIFFMYSKEEWTIFFSENQIQQHFD